MRQITTLGMRQWAVLATLTALAGCGAPRAVAVGGNAPPGQAGVVAAIRTDTVGADQDGAVAEIMGALGQPAPGLPASATEVMVKQADGSTKTLVNPGTDPAVAPGQSVWVSPGPDYHITATP
ncbi:hypothetical protein [Acidocella sp.]|uniref:hypothetical protein n=1 Tax=Acidocella sp. TaxID=50710 RepID=UPI00261FAB6C|nr:hypothetical protein [Acidocella sp.]